MKKTRNLVLILTVSIILLCFAIYFLLPKEFRWAINSVVEVPACSSRIADKLNIEPNFQTVKNHIIQSLKQGMTSDEVEMTLSQFAPIEVSGTYFNEKQEMSEVILVRLCDNPLGNVVLFVYYSEDGYLVNVVDAYAE